MFTAHSEVQKVMEFVQKQWKDNLGIDVQLASQERKVYLRASQTDAPPIFALGWGADYRDEDNWVVETFHPTKGHNRAQQSPADPTARQFMKLTEAAAAESEPKLREDLYFEAEPLLCVDESILIPMWYDVEIYLSKPYLERRRPEMGGRTLRNGTPERTSWAQKPVFQVDQPGELRPPTPEDGFLASVRVDADILPVGTAAPNDAMLPAPRLDQPLSCIVQHWYHDCILHQDAVNRGVPADSTARCPARKPRSATPQPGVESPR